MSSAFIGYLGSYRLLNVVNTGQSSRLWQAYDDQNRKFVGIKTLLDQYTKQKDQIQILKWEYDVASKFSHPKLIRVLDFDWHQKMPYLVMEWFSAPNLKMWINRGYSQYCTYLPKLMPQMVEALFYLHQQGWVHRDIKPDNFLFNNESGEMKLIDFALARRIVTGFGRLFAMKSKTQGTASYMSPEQIRGLPPSPHADIYSLGCTFYELLSTRLPFAGESMSDLLNKHLVTPPPPVTQRNKNVTPEFAAILKMLLAKKPEDRPKSTDELLKMMHAVRIFRRSPIPDDVP
ncbi:MAG: serine/threonine protein kinase [Planctomycetaceae bacterium]|jgi:serine/threonine protein kinase|nr:serine/threonine protein kinase [Planctomycetaceae bacterium]